MQHRLSWPLLLLLACLGRVQSARILHASSSPSSSSSSSSSSTSSSSGSDLPSAWHTGIATNYGGPSESMDPYSPSYGTSDGSCGYGVMDKTKYPYWSVAALSKTNPFYVAGPLGGCGECFEIQCLNSGGQYAGRCNSDPSQRSVTVMISDVCPECETDHIDIQALTYNKMAPMLGGRIDIQYRRVQCTPASNLQVNIDSNSGTGGFLKMSVSMAGGSGGISNVQVKGPNTGWTGLHNLYGAEWELDQQPQLPLDLHIVADTGAEVTAFGVITKSGVTGTLPTGAQFSFNGPASYDQASSYDTSGSSSTSSSSDSSSSTSSSGSASASASGGSSDSSSSSGGSDSSSSSGGSSGSSSSSGGSSDASSSSGGASASAGGSASASAGGASAGGAEVSEYDGPPPSSPAAESSPASTSSSPSSSSSSNSSGSSSPSSSSSSSSPSSSGSSSSSGACADVTPGAYTCSQEQAWGHCKQSWMTKVSSTAPNGYCAQTCGRC